MQKLTIFLLCLTTQLGNAQTDSLYEYFGGVIYLDSMTVTASRSGFDVSDFIDKVETDNSFYQSFKNTRHLSYSTENQIFIKNDKNKLKADYYSKTKQISDGNCREMIVDEEKVNGNFYKKKKEYRYYTAKLFDRVFHTHDKVCEDEKEDADKESPSGMEKHYQELKKLIFSPGQEANVPLIGKKTAIFTEDMRPYYTFSIRSKNYLDGTECYVFTATVRPDFKEDKTVIKYLETWFRKDNFQITARNYRLKYFSLLFDFEVEMKVKLTKIGSLFVPEKIDYKGFFDIPLKKAEYGEFSVRLYDFVD
ncbi:MAG: hypothetical protein ACI85O_000850 [Saprospiraceae bacterium]